MPTTHSFNVPTRREAIDDLATAIIEKSDNPKDVAYEMPSSLERFEGLESLFKTCLLVESVEDFKESVNVDEDIDKLRAGDIVVATDVIDATDSIRTEVYEIVENRVEN